MQNPQQDANAWPIHRPSLPRRVRRITAWFVWPARPWKWLWDAPYLSSLLHYVGSTAVIVNIPIAVVNYREGEEVRWATELIICYKNPSTTQWNWPDWASRWFILLTVLVSVAWQSQRTIHLQPAEEPTLVASCFALFKMPSFLPLLHFWFLKTVRSTLRT